MFNEDDFVVGITYDGEWTVTFVLGMNGAPSAEVCVRVGRGIAKALLSLVKRDGWQVEYLPADAWSARR